MKNEKIIRTKGMNGQRTIMVYHPDEQPAHQGIQEPWKQQIKQEKKMRCQKENLTLEPKPFFDIKNVRYSRHENREYAYKMPKDKGNITKRKRLVESIEGLLTSCKA